MNKKLLYGICAMAFSNFAMAQTQIGATILGLGSNEATGESVSLSANGNRVAIGTPYSTNTAVDIIGYVRVFQNNSGTWNQIGQTITGEALDDNFGIVSISGDGTKIAVGGSRNDGNGANSGHIKIFQYNSTSWVQVGADINGAAAGNQAGTSVSLSNDGVVVAIGAPFDDGSAVNAGHVRVYRWTGTLWVQNGLDINGEAANDEFGCAVSLSLSGTQLAVGARYNDGTGNNAGHVRVFSWNGTAWTQRGGDIDGEATSDTSGSSVSISNGGLKVAIGAPLANGPSGGADCGHVRVYSFGTSWTQQGVDVDGVSTIDHFGQSVSMNGTGTAFISGSPLREMGSTNTGTMAYYKYTGSVWTIVGSETNSGSPGPNQNFGYATAISNDGNTVAIGAPTTGSGRAQIFDYTAALSTNDFTLNNAFKMYPNPANFYFQLSGEFAIEKVEIYSLQGQLVKIFKNENQYSISDLAKGIYMVKIEAREGLASKTLIVE